MHQRRVAHLRRNRLAKGIVLALTPMALLLGANGAAFAQCTTSGTTITCATGSNTNSFASSINNVTFDVQTGAVLSVPPIVGGAALTLNGNGITLDNQGRIDPTINGGLSLAATGAMLGNASANNISVTNESGGVINGLVNIASLMGFGGQALVLDNAGSSVLYNNGSIGMSIFGVGTFTTADAPAILAYGGGQMNLNNAGTITGRVGFLGSTIAGFGNNFVNSGTINGSVYLGNSVSGNTFLAVSGSSVNNAGVATAGTMTVGSSTINFAAAGKVDAGTGSGNALILQNSATGTGSGTGGPVTTISAANYLDFQNLTVNSGTWNLQGNLVSGSATLNGGLVNFNSAGVFGTGALTVAGGGIESAVAGLTLANNISLGTSTLSLEGSNAFSLGGVLSGGGGLSISDTGPVTLAGANTFTGGVNLNAGGLVLANAASLGSGTLTANGSATLNTSSAFVLSNSVQINAGTLSLLGSNPLTLAGSLSGGGNISWNGAGTLSLNSIDSLSGSFLLNDGTLAVGAGGSLSPTGAISLAAGTTLDLSLGGNQSIGSLAGAGGTVNLGVNTLTLNGIGNTVYNGVIVGLGGLVKLGSGTQMLGGANIFAGGVALDAGGLLLGNNAALGSGMLVANGSVTMDSTA
ncbi:MAG TPA: transporter, partial [Dyella sp.]|nr:transporter [Dyella sp.]